jgi:hypothetical protein
MMIPTTPARPQIESHGGFGSLEMLISLVLVLAISGAALGILVQVERVAAVQADFESARDGALVAIDLVERILRQAGNDPSSSGISPLTALSSCEVRTRADLTGSGGPAEPDKGDPDGDTEDAYEDVVIRYAQSADTLRLESAGGGVQTVADNLSAFAIELMNDAGGAVAAGECAARARISLTSRGRSVDPQTRLAFAMRLSGDVELKSGCRP